jgi:hypothetical protein
MDVHAASIVLVRIVEGAKAQPPQIFKFAVCTNDGDVWLGTSAGLTRYSASKDSWTHYTRADGLPGDQVSAIAFNSRGDIVIGTKCDGIAIARRESDYGSWRPVPLANPELAAFTGSGLPSRLINDLLVTADGTILAATSGGLAWSRDGGDSWRFRRGLDYADRIPERKDAEDQPAATDPETVLPEDYVTCMAADDNGILWLGFRQEGLVAIDSHALDDPKTLPATGLESADYPRAILLWPSSPPWVASYGKGLLRVTEGNPGMPKPNSRSKKPSVEAAKFPAEPTPDFIPADNAADALRRLTLALARMPERNAVWWAANKRKFFMPLLRSQISDPGSSTAASSYYQLNLFANWETNLPQLDITPARDIEKAMRWDGITPSMSGMGYQLISSYVSTNSEKFKGLLRRQ